MFQKKDLLILANLRKNSRESLTRLSKRTSIPVSTIYDKLRTFKNGLITKHTTLVDFEKLGFHTRANILLKIERDQRNDAKEFLIKSLHVNSVSKISNGYDYLVEAIFKNVKDVEDFLDIFEGKFNIEKTQIFYIIEDLKKEAFMENDQLIDLVA